MVWSRASASLDDPAGAGIHDDLVYSPLYCRVIRMEAATE